MGLVLVSPEKIIIEKSLRLNFFATNNEAEYETLLRGMVMVQKMGGKTGRIVYFQVIILEHVQGYFLYLYKRITLSF